MERYLCRRRTNLVADWNSCLMPRDTDRRLLGLWGLELSVERRMRQDENHFTAKVHSLCTHKRLVKRAGTSSACCWLKMEYVRNKKVSILWPSQNIIKKIMFQCRQCSSCFLTTEYKVKTISHLQYLTNKTNPDYKSETHTHTQCCRTERKHSGRNSDSKS